MLFVLVIPFFPVIPSVLLIRFDLPLKDGRSHLNFTVRCSHGAQLALLCGVAVPPTVAVAIGSQKNTKSTIGYEDTLTNQFEVHAPTQFNF